MCSSFFWSGNRFYIWGSIFVQRDDHGSRRKPTNSSHSLCNDDEVFFFSLCNGRILIEINAQNLPISISCIYQPNHLKTHLLFKNIFSSAFVHISDTLYRIFSAMTARVLVCAKRTNERVKNPERKPTPTPPYTTFTCTHTHKYLYIQRHTCF